MTGIDYSKVSVEESKKLNAIAIKQGRCDIVYGDVSSMPFDDEAFDCVSAFETVYFWEDLEKCFAEVHRVMKTAVHSLYATRAMVQIPRMKNGQKK